MEAVFVYSSYWYRIYQQDVRIALRVALGTTKMNLSIPEVKYLDVDVNEAI